MPHMLPPNATDFEKVLSIGLEHLGSTEHAASIAAGIKLRSPPDSFLPYLNYEYGLGPIANYFPDIRLRIPAGIRWQRVLGSHQAISLALNWINYTAAIEHFPSRRRMWNRFMLNMTPFFRLEDDLNDIDYLANLSAPVRSHFWRGFHVHDIRALEFSYTKYGNVLFGDYSGVRIKPDGAKWSYGRRYNDWRHLTQAELTSLGAWVAPSGGAAVGWGNFTWAASTFPWLSLDEQSRTNLIFSSLTDRPIWIVFYDDTNTVIGYRRAKVVAPVTLDNAGGQYEYHGVKFRRVTSAATYLYLEFLTDFGDGYGSTSSNWKLSFDNTILDVDKPGQPWATAEEISAGIEISDFPNVIEFARTVREQFKLLLIITEQTIPTEVQLLFLANQTIPDFGQSATLIASRDIVVSQSIEITQSFSASSLISLSANQVEEGEEQRDFSGNQIMPPRSQSATGSVVISSVSNATLPNIAQTAVGEVTQPSGPPIGLDLNFATNTYTGAAAATDVLATDYSGTRNAKNAAGVNTSFGSGILARTDLGIFRAGGGTPPNLMSNPTMSGAVAGSPGTLPTGWSLGTIPGATRTIAIEAGTPGAITVRYQGTLAANASGFILFPEVAATDADVTTWKLKTSLAAGNMTNMQFARVYAEAKTAGGGGAGADGNIFGAISLTGSPVENINTNVDFAAPTMAKISSYLQFISTSGGAIDFTIRIEKESFLVTNNAAATAAENVTAIGALDTALKTTVGAVMIEFGSLSDHGARFGTSQSGRILSSRSEALEIIKQLGPTRMLGKNIVSGAAAYAGAGGILGVNRVMLSWDNAANAGAGQIKLCYNGGTVVTATGKLNDAGDANTQVNTAKFLQGLVGFMRRVKTWTTAPDTTFMKIETALTSFNHNVADAVNLFNRSNTFDSDFDNGFSLVTRNTNPAGYGQGTAPVYNNNGKFNPRQINGKEYALGFSNHDAKEYQFSLDPTHPDLIGLGYSPFSVADGILTAKGHRVNGTTIPAAINTIMNDTVKIPNLQWAALSGTRHPYTSGSLTSQGTFKQAFGYWEANASADAYYPGRWSAFWMGGDRAQTLIKNAAVLTAQGEDPAGAGTWPPELDVMECQTLQAFGNAWWGPAWWQAVQIPWNNGKSVADDTGNDWVDHHAYSLLWEAGGFSYYLDGRRYQYFARPVAGQPKWPGAGENWTAAEANRWVYHDNSIEMYIIMTHTIGSDQTSLDGTLANQLIDAGATTPDEVQVRWRHVKVWSA